MSPNAQRADLACGYVLHQRPYRDTSLIVEIYTRDHGRFHAFARAARGPRTRFLGLQPFRPLLMSWSGRGEAPTLTAAEADGPPPPPLAADRLLSAFYLNELLIKLTVAHDPHAELYAHYASTIERLRSGQLLDLVLRQFEKRLLDLLGYGTDLSYDTSGSAVITDAYYHFRAGEGVWRAEAGVRDQGVRDQGILVTGRVLLAMANDEPLTDLEGQRQMKTLLRAALDHCLDGRELNVRKVARAVARIGQSSGG